MNLDFDRSWNALQKCNELKEQGNELYKTEKFAEANMKFHFATLEAKSVTYQGDPEMVKMLEDEKKKLLVHCYNNMAICLLRRPNMRKKEDFMRVAGYCDKVLAIEPENLKALMKKATALMEAEEWQDAYDVLTHKCPPIAATEALKKKCRPMLKRPDDFHMPALNRYP